MMQSKLVNTISHHHQKNVGLLICLLLCVLLIAQQTESLSMTTITRTPLVATTSFIPKYSQTNSIINRKQQPQKEQKQHQGMTMKVSRSKSKSVQKDSTLAIVNSERTKSAGRRGTKNYIDPNKVFVGNVPYNATEMDVLDFLSFHLGGTNDIESIKIIRDWKTGQSKGYGFINFMDPIKATSAIVLVRGKKLNGRILNLSQGQRKKPESIVIVKDRKERTTTTFDKSDEEMDVIDSALDDAEDILDNQTNLDNDAADDADGDEDVEEGETDAVFSLLQDEDDEFLDDDNYSDDNDDENFEFDGVFEEEYNSQLYEVDGVLESDSETNKSKQMNREQRREAARKMKRTKLPHKGFG